MGPAAVWCLTQTRAACCMDFARSSGFFAAVEGQFEERVHVRLEPAAGVHIVQPGPRRR